MKITSVLLAIAAFLLPLGCKDPQVVPKENRVLTHQAADYSGKFAHEWVQLTDQMIRENQVQTPDAARIYGYLGLTLWESVCNGVPEGESLASQLNGYNDAAPVDISKEYDWGIVMCTAMSTVMPKVMEHITNTQRDRIEVLAIVQTARLVADGIDFYVRDDSKKLGLAIGAKILHRIQNDGRETIRNAVPVILIRDAAHPWYWAPSPPNQQALEPLWGTVRTFLLDNAQGCQAAAPYPYSVQAASPFYADAQEVYQTERNSLHRSIAYHWEDGPGRTSGPAGHWMNITEQLLENSGKNLAECAKTYCLVGCTAADAVSVSWSLKYKYNQLLPATYIHEQFSAAWQPLTNNPPFPDYTSVPATLGGAIPVVLGAMVGNIAFMDKTQLGSALYTPDGGPFVLPERIFESLTQAGEEEAESGILSGINFRRACDLGLQSGRCVGNTMLSRLHFGF